MGCICTETRGIAKAKAIDFAKELPTEAIH
jgi:hypothetical protein